METKKCSKCLEVKDLTKFYFNKTLNKYYSWCKSCRIKFIPLSESRKKYVAKYFASEKGKESVRKTARKMLQIHREKIYARLKLRYHIKKGYIIKPKKCEKCNLEKKLHGHHEDYNKPLEVMWLCTRCHADRHLYLKANNIII